MLCDFCFESHVGHSKLSWYKGTKHLELLDFMVQEKINRGRQTDDPAGRHSNLLTHVSDSDIHTKPVQV